MADVKRMNQIIQLVANGRRDLCETDEERRLYDSIQRQERLAAEYGIGIDMIHEAPD